MLADLLAGLGVGDDLVFIVRVALVRGALESQVENLEGLRVSAGNGMLHKKHGPRILCIGRGQHLKGGGVGSSDHLVKVIEVVLVLGVIFLNDLKGGGVGPGDGARKTSAQT